MRGVLCSQSFPSSRGCTLKRSNISVGWNRIKSHTHEYRTWNAGSRIACPPIAHAGRLRDRSYNNGAESASEELEATEG